MSDTCKIGKRIPSGFSFLDAADAACKVEVSGGDIPAKYRERKVVGFRVSLPFADAKLCGQPVFSYMYRGVLVRGNGIHAPAGECSVTAWFRSVFGGSYVVFIIHFEDDDDERPDPIYWIE